MTDKADLFREIRKYIYGVSIAFVPVAVYYGWMEPELDES